VFRYTRKPLNSIFCAAWQIFLHQYYRPIVEPNVELGARRSREIGEATEAGKTTNLQNRHEKARPA